MHVLTAYGAPPQTMKTLVATCESVAINATTRHITDDAIVAEQETNGVYWRRAYMRGITNANVQ